MFRNRFKGRAKPGGNSGGMNKTEAAYADELERQRQAGVIAWYKFECMRFRLANLTTYTPDFIVMLANGDMQAHEVKGHWEQHSRIKIKVAAEMFPLTFIGITKGTKAQKGQWLREVFGDGDPEPVAPAPLPGVPLYTFEVPKCDTK